MAAPNLPPYLTNYLLENMGGEGEKMLGTGLIQDTIDARDFKYSDLLLGAAPVVDWEKGFNVYESIGIPMIVQDQNGSSSCVGQGVAMHLRAIYKKITGEDVDFSRKFIYSQIASGLGSGASLRDGVWLAATKGVCLEKTLPSYQNGKAPSEEYMYSKAEITEDILKEALPFDIFNYRVIPGYTTDISLFAHAIETSCGLVGGFTGTNQGWMRPVIQPPKQGESKWGHCVYLAGYGIYEDKKCLFTPNSWGGRYTIKEGRWKGMQAIPEEYFLASAQTAVGPAPGAYVFNAWVLVQDSTTPPNVKLMDFLKKNENKLVQNVQGNGQFGIVIDGKIHVASPERAAELCLTVMMRSGQGVAVPKELWDGAPKEQF